MNAAVVDTSVIIKWFVMAGESHVAQAKALLLGHRLGEVRLHVPALALYEAGNAFLQCGHALTTAAQARCLSDLFLLEWSVHELTPPRALAAQTLAGQRAITFYDACFVTLAQELGVPLITADERLLRRLHPAPFVHSLASYA